MLAGAPRAASAKRDHAITRSPEKLGVAAAQRGVTWRRAIATVASVRSRPSLGGADPPRRAMRQSATRRGCTSARDNARARALGGLLGSPPPFLAENTASAVTRPQRMTVHRSGPRISGASLRRAACAERTAIDIERTSVVIADSARALRVRPKCVQTVRSCTRTNRQTIFVGASIPAQRVDRQTKEARRG